MLCLGSIEKSVCLKPQFYPAYHFISTQKAMKFGGVMTEKIQHRWVRCGSAFYSQRENAKIHERRLGEIIFNDSMSQPTRLRDAHYNPTFPGCFCLPVGVCIIKSHRFKTPSLKLMWNGMPFPVLQGNCALDPFDLHKWLQMYRRCLPRKEPQHGSMLKISET